jgi:endonuclease-3 related protein
VPNFTESAPRILEALDAADVPGSAPVPGAALFEAVATTYLAQWGEARAVARAIDALRESGWLDPNALAEADPAEVADALRDAGAKGLVKLIPALQRVALWAAKALEGDPATASLRDDLRSLKGVGPATADAILLYGLGRAAYPVDRATYRILVRHGWIDPSAEYDEARSLVERAFPDDSAGLARLSAGFEQVGKSCCRASVARCDRCPLRPLLPEGGPLGDA